MVGRSNEPSSAADARPAWPPRRVTKDGHVLSGSFTGRYERARRALRAERRTALLGFPLPAAQRVDARYEKTYRAHCAEKPPSRVRVVVGKGRYIWHTAPQVGAPCCGVAA